MLFARIEIENRIFGHFLFVIFLFSECWIFSQIFSSSSASKLNAIFIGMVDDGIRPDGVDAWVFLIYKDILFLKRRLLRFGLLNIDLWHLLMHYIIWIIRIIDLTDICLIQLIHSRPHQTLLNLRRYIALVLAVELLLLQMLLDILAQLPQVPLLEQIIHVLLEI